MRRLLWFALFISQQQSSDTQDLLDRVKARISNIIDLVPRYTCEERIERFWFDTNAVLYRSDRLRLDVAVGSSQEMYSWHDDGRFQSEDIGDIAPSGPAGSGMYFSFLSNIFFDEVAVIKSAQVVGSSAVFRYSVPLSRSTFQIKIRDAKQVTGYEGEFKVSVPSGELQQLIVGVPSLPEESFAKSLQIVLIYGRQVLENRKAPLPEKVTLKIYDLKGDYTESRIQYRGCRQFVGESSIYFDETTQGQKFADKTLPIVSAPPGISIRIRLLSGVNPETAWAGDKITGVLTQDVIDDQHRVIAPKGAIANGRLMRVEKVGSHGDVYNLDVQFNQTGGEECANAA